MGDGAEDSDAQSTLSEHQAALRAAGAHSADVAAWTTAWRGRQRSRRSRRVRIEPINWPAVECWVRVSSQWRVISGMSVRWLAIDAVAVWATLRAMGRPDDLDAYDRVQVIGAEVARRLNAAAERDQGRDRG